MATILAGVAGPDAWLGSTWGQSRLPKLDLIAPGFLPGIRRVLDQLAGPVQVLNRRLIEGASAYSPAIFDLVTLGQIHAGGSGKKANAIPHADVIARHRHMLTAPGPTDGLDRSYMARDFGIDPTHSRLEAVTHPTILLEHTKPRDIKGLLSQCHNRVAMVIRPSLRIGPANARCREDLEDIVELLEGAILPSTGKKNSPRIDPQRLGRIHAILTPSRDDLASIPSRAPVLFTKFLMLDEVSGDRGARQVEGNHP